MAEASSTPFLTDVQEIRKRAREHLNEGPLTPGYQGDVDVTIQVLNDALATELVCWLRYTYHFIAAQGINSESVRDEFREHAEDERVHALWLGERIDQLGGTPRFNPEGMLSRSATQYVEGANLVEMIEENLVAERIVIQTYQEMIRYFAHHDPTSRRLMEKILAHEEEHAADMHDLLVRHQGKPTLEG